MTDSFISKLFMQLILISLLMEVAHPPFFNFITIHYDLLWYEGLRGMSK